MQPLSKAQPQAWLAAALAGLVVPSLAMLRLADAAVPLPLMTAPLLAVGLMGAGMIGGAAAGRLGTGVLLALLTGAGLVALAHGLGLPPLPLPLATGLAFLMASISFAARGALFARSAGTRGWWIAVFVVSGEAAILATALAMPGALPAWLLVLLPAQWASTAILASLAGAGTAAASSVLIALAGTAAATLLVARLWPRRWPYLIMFTAWLGFSALVWHRPGPPLPHIDVATAARPAGAVAPPK
jgi:hypothetical protein